MSGFGGFGQQQPASAFGGSGFGAPQTQTPAAPFGSSPAPGFGQPTTGFGFAGASSSIPSNFGASNTTQPFGSAQQQSNPMNAASFGTPSNSGFGSSTASTADFGMNTAPINVSGGTPSGFGSSAGARASFGNATNSGFGSSSSTNTGKFPGSANNTMQFGTTDPRGSNVPFGNSSAPSGFGGASPPTQNAGFGVAASIGFGGSTSQTSAPSNVDVGGTTTQTSSAPLVFGSSSTVTFGSSSTTAPSSTFGQGNTTEPAASSSGFRFGQVNASSKVATPSGFGHTITAPSDQPGFAALSAEPSSSAFGQKDEIPSDSGFNSNASFSGNKTTFGFGSNSDATTSPFGKPAQSAPQNDNRMGTSTSSPFVQRIPRKERSFESTGQSPMDAPLASSRNTVDGDEKLAALKAKIQEKKNRLLKMKKDNEGNEGGNNSSDVKNTSDSTAAKHLSNSELAAKNALRFASNNQGQTTSKLLPTDLQGRAGQDIQSSSSDAQEGNSTEEEDIDDLQIRTLSGAKDLVGVCSSMCPDEELLRREREGDIQLLEVRWTLSKIFYFVTLRVNTFSVDYRPRWIAS